MPNSVAGKEEEEEEGRYATCSTRSMKLSSDEESINFSHVFLICPSKMPAKLSLVVPAFPSSPQTGMARLLKKSIMEKCIT